MKHIYLFNKINSSRDTRAYTQQDRFNILFDNYKVYIRNKINNTFGSQTRAASETITFCDYSSNTYKFCHNLLSVVYKEAPQRDFTKRTDLKLFNKVVDVNSLDCQMESVNLITSALNECFVRPVFRNEMIEYDIIPPHKCEVLSDGPHLNAIIYPVEIDDVEHFCYFDDKLNILMTLKGQVLSSVAHNCGMVPIITYRRMKPIDGFWLGMSGEDLVELFINETMELSWLKRLFYLQSFNQLYRKSSTMGDEIGNVNTPAVIGPDTILQGDYGTLNLQTDITAHHQIVLQKRRQVASNWGISADVLDSSKHTSGIERALSSSGLVEHRKKLIKHFRPEDKKLMKLTTTIWNNESSPSDKKFSDNVEPKIDYAEPTILESRLDDIALLEKEVAMGVGCGIDYMRKKNPDLSEEDAIKKMERYQELNKLNLDFKQSRQVPANNNIEQKSIEGADGGRPENTDPLEFSKELEDKE